MINNYLCESCKKSEVCRIKDILSKFSEDAKKPLGVDITMDQCANFEDESSEFIEE